MDYLEEAKAILRGHADIDMEVAISMQADATVALAFAVVALVERLDGGESKVASLDLEGRINEIEEVLNYKADDGVFKSNVGELDRRVDELERKLGSVPFRDIRDTRLFESLLERSKDLPGDTPVRVSVNIENGYNLNISLAGLREILQ